MRLLILGTFIAFASCDQIGTGKALVQYRNGRQMLTLNDRTLTGDSLARPVIGVITADSVLLGGQFSAKIFLKTSDYRLIEAYKDLNITDTTTVDTAIVTSEFYKPFSGGIRLLVENDTLGIYFRPGKVGQLTFSNVTLLTIDKDKIFRTIPFSFQYKVYGK